MRPIICTAALCLAACGPGGGGTTFLPQEADVQEILRGALALDGMAPATVPATGSATYTGDLAFVERGADRSVVNAYTADLTLNVDFAQSTGGISGAISGITEASDGLQTGDLALGSGLLPGQTYSSVLSRSGTIITAPVRTFSTFAVGINDTLADSGAGSYTVDIALVGDFLGTDGASIGGIVQGEIARGDAVSDVDGAFLAAR